MMFYDITNRESFERIKTFWIYDMLKYGADMDPMKILIGTQSDLIKDDNDNVSQQDAEKMAEELNIPYCIQTSAKTGQNVPDGAIDSWFDDLCNVEMNKQQRKLMPYYG